MLRPPRRRPLDQHMIHTYKLEGARCGAIINFGRCISGEDNQSDAN